MSNKSCASSGCNDSKASVNSFSRRTGDIPSPIPPLAKYLNRLRTLYRLDGSNPLGASSFLYGGSPFGKVNSTELSKAPLSKLLKGSELLTLR